jgi:hypothetical protein
MKCIAFSQLFRPFTQLLGQSTIEGHFTIPKRQLQIPRDLFAARQHLRDVVIASRKQVFQGAALRRGFRMQRKSNPLNSDLEFAP